jgi:hypothetical protein
MGRPKKQPVNYIDKVHYHAASDPYLGAEIYISESKTQAITDLREDEGDVDTIYIFEIKCIGKYKVNFTLEKID